VVSVTAKTDMVVRGVWDALHRGHVTPNHTTFQVDIEAQVYRYRLGIEPDRFLDLIVSESKRMWRLERWGDGVETEVLTAECGGFAGRGWREDLIRSAATAIPTIAMLVGEVSLTWLGHEMPARRIVAGSDCNYSYGWDYNNHTKAVYRAWTSSTVHGEGWPTERPARATQGARALFASRDDALLAMRIEMQARVALALREIDLAIGAGDGAEFALESVFPGRSWI
jgi:hypothetical protein